MAAVFKLYETDTVKPGDEHVILRLNVDEENAAVVPYTRSETTPPFSLLQEDEPVDTQVSHDNRSTLKVVNLLHEFEEKNKIGEWPTATSIHCYHCVHGFTTPPYGLPAKYVDNKYVVTGCFCSLECAKAYNEASACSIDEKWERNGLLHSLARSMGINDRIKAAPPRVALQVFGGHLSIDDFRAFTISGKVVHVNTPPMQTVRQQVEEINASDAHATKYIPLDHDRIKLIKDKINLKRSKPLNANKNTLDHTMNLVFGAN